jgi:predicted nucleotidyltransferase component of viral defense system
MPGDDRLKELIRILGRVVESHVLPGDAYLAGGTALYLYFGHRQSIDLDFFCPASFRSELLAARFREEFPEADFEVLGKDTLILYIGPDKTQVSLFSFPFPLLGPLVFRKIGERTDCALASLEDIAAMKALAINQRGTAKDFVDLRKILETTEYAYSRLAELVRKKYGVREDYHLKTGLAYFEDAEKDAAGIVLLDPPGTPRFMTPAEWASIKDFFTRFVR